jgi:hypothetical protein
MNQNHFSFLIYAAGVGGTVIFSLAAIMSYRIEIHRFIELLRPDPLYSFFMKTIMFIILAILCYFAVMLNNVWSCKSGHEEI